MEQKNLRYVGLKVIQHENDSMGVRSLYCLSVLL
jgi:hypothetical protein